MREEREGGREREREGRREREREALRLCCPRRELSPRERNFLAAE